MPIYKYLIFDVDDTLLDFYHAFQTAQRDIAEKLGIVPSKEYLETDEKCGWKAWEESGLDQTEDKNVQDNYHAYCAPITENKGNILSVSGKIKLFVKFFIIEFLK